METDAVQVISSSQQILLSPNLRPAENLRLNRVTETEECKLKIKLFSGLMSVRDSDTLLPWTSACGVGQHFQDFGLSLSLYGPPSRQIRYILTQMVIFG